MTTIRLYNTRTRTREVFDPIDPTNVRIYACGPTVYDQAHIGNARPAVVFDILFRLLRHVYGDKEVTYVRNITDVDDKINAKSSETGRPVRDIADETINWYRKDMEALGVLAPTHQPRCTEYIPQMIAMGEKLISKGFAYEAEGHVLFAVDSHDRYGALSSRSTKDMMAGARVEVAPYKKNPMDFVIWKPSTENQPGWDSPWGRGRPGWHIECSAMARDLLGEVFDIHAGGIDLIFPHHENELAQSCCAHDTEMMARFWMHNEMVRVKGRKMSKSLGNFLTVRDLLDKNITGEVVRFVMLSTHYRSPLDWTTKRVNEARATIRRWSDAICEADRQPQPPLQVTRALCDDLNTHLAISELSKLYREKNYSALRAGAYFLGLLKEERAYRGPALDDTWTDAIERTLLERAAAKDIKDFAKADEIRNRLLLLGINIKDTPEGTVWELAPDFDATRLEFL